MLRRRRKTSLFYGALLLFALLALWRGLDFASRDESRDEGSSAQPFAAVDERGEAVTPPASDTPQTGSVSDSRLAAIQEAEGKTSSLLPESLASNPIVRVWFSEDGGMYVEYRRAGHAVADRMAFFSVVSSGEDAVISRRALYGQSEAGGWEIIEGDDALFTKPQKDLYEKNVQGEWVKVN